MALNPTFFVRQDAARRSTLLLSFYFLLAVATILLLCDLAAGVVVHVLDREPLQVHPLWHRWTLRAVLSPALLIVMGAVIGFLQMRQGGHSVARLVRATPLDLTTRDELRRRYVNVVEEMAIASGLRLPALYVMEHESGINAFVAGYSANQAVLVITWGALRTLDRDELQGVVGHEFSHILNGDMRINMRLVSLLTGLLVLGQTGRMLLSVGRVSAEGSMVIGAGSWLMGAVLYPVGYTGLIAGRLIKAAISRQRESLADACSVQFTRKPDGLAGALLKIGLQAEGARLSDLYAESMSHMCFGPSIDVARWYATHPPLEERIKAIAPEFLVRRRARLFKLKGRWQALALNEAPDRVTDLEQPWVGVAETADTGIDLPLAARVGTVRPQDVLVAAEFRRKLSLPLARALESIPGCRALLFALVAEQSLATYRLMEDFFRQEEGAEFFAEVTSLRVALESSGLVRLPLVDLALPRLSLLQADEASHLLARLDAFSALDNRLSVFEFALLLLLRQQLLQLPPAAGKSRLADLRQPICEVIAVLVRHGDLLDEHQQLAYSGTLEGIFADLPPLAALSDDLPRMAGNLRQLGALRQEDRRQLLELCAKVVRYDGEVSRKEYELLRVIAALLGCSLPLSLLLPE